MDDSKILELYLARDERAIGETDRKYGSYCFRVANAILNDREDAAEVVNDTWYQAWNSIPPQRPAVLKLYLAKITRNLAFSAYRSRRAGKRGGGEMELALEELGDCVGTSGNAEDAVNARELAAAIQSFLGTLPQRDRHIFIRRYFHVDSVETIALQYGLKSDSVHQILSRTRRKLKTHLIKEGYIL